MREAVGLLAAQLSSFFNLCMSQGSGLMAQACYRLSTAAYRLPPTA